MTRTGIIPKALENSNTDIKFDFSGNMIREKFNAGSE
jgi:hypothetical protein